MIEEYYAYSLDDIVRFVLQIEKSQKENLLYFRGGESKDHMEKAIAPSIYRDDNLQNEEYYYREMQIFNDNEFQIDKSAFDKLARMQHYFTPTRMIDISEDLMGALFFSFDGKKDGRESVIYVLEIDKNKIKYYDSDAVSVVSNLAKIPLYYAKNEKAKKQIHTDTINAIDQNLDTEEFNELRSIKFLLHEIKEEKPQFENIIVPEHLFSIFCVKPKYTNRRISKQKGAFLLFGMNKDNYKEPVKLLKQAGSGVALNDEISDYHPVVKITKIVIDSSVNASDLEKLGITKPYIYPDLENVSQWLKN